LFSAGSNRFGQCATELGFAELSATDSRHASNGFVRCQLNEKSITGAVSYINAEGDSSFFTVDDKIYGVGFNVNGNLGIGSTDNLSVTTELSPVG
jgi:alpha-tubulin suppressor-like RCC1 family protein